MKKSLSLLVLTAISAFLYSQEKIKMKLADSYFDKYAYTDAAPLYEDLAAKNPKNIHYVSRAAESFRLMGNTQKAEMFYSSLITLENADPASFFYYAQMLDQNKKYEEARKYYEIYKGKKDSDSRASNKMNTASMLRDLYKDSSSYRIANAVFNSGNSDFGMFPFGSDAFFFASNRKNETYTKHTYNWNNQPFLDLYTVKRNSDGSFAAPQPVPGEVNSQYHEGPIYADASSNTFYVTRNNYNDNKYQKSKDGVNKLKLYIVNLDGSASKTFSDFEYNNNEYSVGHATLSSDGQRLYFVSDMPGGIGGTDIYVCLKEGNKWGTPRNLGREINTEGNEMFPFISEDNELYFSSDGYYGLGGLDIYLSKLSNGMFSAPKNMGYPINSNKDDFSLFIASDKKSGFFSSNRAGGKGDDDIYAFTVLKKHYYISGKAMDKETGAVLPNAKIQLTDETGNIISELTSAADGSFRFEIEPEMSYVLNGRTENYFDVNNKLSPVIPGGETEVRADALFEKDPGLSLYGLITDKATGAPIQGAHVVIMDDATNTQFIDLSTPPGGDFRKALTGKKVTDVLNYQIRLEKEGYLAKTVAFRAEITKPGEIKVHETIDISLDKIGVGADLGKLIDIKPIYFDLAKWNIRKDAQVELDKIVKVMNENPTMEIELGSHTDCRSSATYNLSLSDKRAKASAEYIKKSISNPNRIFGKGYGESQLINKCECEGEKKVPCTEAEHQMNRRTEFKIVKF